MSGRYPGGMSDLRTEEEWIQTRLAGARLADAAGDWACARTPVVYEAGMVEVVGALEDLGRAVGEDVEADTDDPTDLRRVYENVIVAMGRDLARGWVEDTDAAFGVAIRWALEHGAPADWHASVGKIVDVLDDLPEGDQDLGLHEMVLALVLRVDAPSVPGAGEAMPRCLQRSWELLAGLGHVLPPSLVDRLVTARSGVERRVMGRPL